MVRLAVLGKSRQAREAHDAEAEEDRSKDDEHVVSDPVDDRIEALSMLIVAHQGACEWEADEGWVDGVSCEDKPHSDLRLVAWVEDFGIGRELHLVLYLQELLKDDRICHHDKEAGQANHLQWEIFEAAHDL